MDFLLIKNRLYKKVLFFNKKYKLVILNCILLTINHFKNNHMEEIIKYWSEFDQNKLDHVHIHDEDRKIDFKNKQIKDVINYHDFIHHEKFGNVKNELHFNLLPEPYVGDIKNATIYILLLNPGFSIADYYVESKDDLRQSILNSIKQEFKDEEYPLIWLNPKYLWTPGGQWTERKLKDLICHVKETNENYSYSDALKHVSKKVAIIQLVPYHSKSFGLGKRMMKMESVNRIKKFVKNDIIKKAEKDKACIIQTRSISEWNLNLHKDNTKNIIIYDRGQRRSASLSEKSPAWEKMKEFI